jgi:EAL domain-containing protein (putative c-di-GMP-specific phosphodiesterase class I)
MDEMTSSFIALDNLKELGLNISIDDFGTGYSSMSYFKNIPASELKNDQTFV